MSGLHILDAPEGSDIAGFAVDGLLGTGGYGVVYRASRGGEVVALELQSLEHLGRWAAQREVSILLRLTHPNVVGFRACGLYPERAPRWFYLAMEYVRGRTLSQWVDEENPGARYVATAADDLYALGVVFYWVLTARYPFAGAEAPSEVDAVISVEPVAPWVLNPRVPVELSALCLRLLSKQPEARGSAKGLREEVEAVLARADARWEEPLYEAHPEAPPVPAPDGHPEARAMPVLQVRARPATEPAPPESVMFRATAVVGMALGLMVAVLVALEWRPPLDFSVLAGALPGREVALVDLPPASERAAAPLFAVLPPAAVASPATPPQEEDVPVNVKKTPDVSATPVPASLKSRALKSMVRAVSTAATCTGLACASSPQLRPPPPAPEPCPPGAAEAMRKLGIEAGDSGSIYFLENSEREQVITVREQRVRVQVGGFLAELNNGTLEGRLMLGDRVYGRFTEAYTGGGKERIPVCLELTRVDERERQFKTGIDPEPDSLSADSARIWSAQTVRAVTSFK